MYSFFDGTDYIHYNRYLFNRIQNILFNENVRAYFYASKKFFNLALKF